MEYYKTGKVCKHCGSDTPVKPCYYCWIAPEKALFSLDVSYSTPRSARTRWKRFPSYEAADKWLKKKGYYALKVIEDVRSVGVLWNISRPPKPVPYKEWRQHVGECEGRHPGFPDPDLMGKAMYFDECDRAEAVRLGITY